MLFPLVSVVSGVKVKSTIAASSHGKSEVRPSTT